MDMARPSPLQQDTSGQYTFHSLPIAEVYAALDSSPGGLSTDEVRTRLIRYGPNELREVKGPPLILRFLSNFTHLMALLLWMAGLVSFIAHLPQLGIAIWLVNVINGIFSFWQEYKAERATEALRKLLPSYARVRRSGQEVRIPSEELVPGDVLLLGEGEHISADARLIEAADLQVDQSTLTGESHPVRKSEAPIHREGARRAELPCLVFAGTNVVAGTGTAVVFATGMRTEFGKIAQLTQSVQDERSPLEIELRHATRAITALAIGVGALFYLLSVLLVRGQPADAFIFAIGMVAAFVPEGMLPTVTLTLALGVQRMAKHHALIKRLSSVETLGCTTVICTDKTGTLTENEMTVCNLWASETDFVVTGSGYAPEGHIESSRAAQEPDQADVRRLLVAASLCNDAHIVPPDETSGRWLPVGDPTDAALLVAAMKGGVDPAEEARQAPRKRELPFDSHRKCMSTIHQCGDSIVVYTKGAPAELIQRCARFMRNGQERVLEADQRRTIVEAIDAYARAGLRVLAVAERHLPPDVLTYTPETVERDLTFLGLTAMFDPPRPEVKDAIGRCHQAGIRIIMITGDYGLTAESIARRIGIVHEEHPTILTGADLDEMDDVMLRERLHGDVLLARVDPEDKQRVVTALQQIGEIVAVTGDGVNDAPALKQANIGVAMGIAGTDVAKEAADIVLTDDNFASIVNAVEEGRAVYGNIRKFVTYIFTSNMAEAIPFILYAVSGGRIPLALTVMEVLAIDLGTDMMPALALGAEQAEPGVMRRGPRDPKAHIITPALLLHALVILGLAESIVSMTAFYVQYWTSGYAGQWLDLPATGTLYRTATAMALGGVVAAQIGNVFAQRTERASIMRVGFLGNTWIWIGIATEIALVSAIIYIPALQGIFTTAPLSWHNWLFLLACTPVLLIIEEIRRAFNRRRQHRATRSRQTRGL